MIQCEPLQGVRGTHRASYSHPTTMAGSEISKRPAPHVDITLWVSQFLASNVDVCLLQIRFTRLLSAESHSVAQHLHGGTSGVDTKATLISCSSPLCHYYFYYYYYCSSSLPPGSTPSLTCLPPWFLRPLCPVGRFSQATLFSSWLLWGCPALVVPGRVARCREAGKHS